MAQPTRATPVLASLARIVLLALICCAAQAAAAQTGPWRERPYDPPVGSRWQIASDTLSEEIRAGGPQVTRTIRVRAELTIDAKLPDGFRVTYVTRDIAIAGTAPGLELASTAFAAMKDIRIHARTDASGKPLEIENLAEVKASMREVAARIVKPFEGRPELAAILRDLMNGLINADGATAAAAFMEDLPALAAGQSTGLTPGGTRREEEAMQTGFSPTPVKAVLVSRLIAWDDATGKARILRTRELDGEAIRAVTIAIAERLIAASGDPQARQMTEIVRQIAFKIDADMTIDVEGGMTRTIEDRSTTTAAVMGHEFRKVEKKTVTVTRM